MPYATLTGNEALALFREIVDDQSVDTDTILDNLNSAQDELIMERPWVWFLAADRTTVRWLTSDTFLTGHTVPSGFFYQASVYVEGFVNPFTEVPFEMRERYRDISYRVYFDHRLQKLHFTGNTAQNRAVYLTYVVQPTEIEDDDTTIANWPGNLHRMLVYHAVMLWLGGTDADNITKLMRQEIAAKYDRLHTRAIKLDAKLRGKARNYQSFRPSIDVTRQADVVSEI